jgi:hypothetical protein
MRMPIVIVLLILFIGLAASVQLGGTGNKAILLGSLSKNAINETNILNETNTTNQSNLTEQYDSMVEIRNPMSTIPVSSKSMSRTSPDSIQSNSIVYRFTT